MNTFRWNAFVFFCKSRLYIIAATFLLCAFWPYKSFSEIWIWPAAFALTCVFGWIGDGNGTWLTESMLRPRSVQIHLLKRITRRIEYRKASASIVAWAVKVEASGLNSMSLVSPNEAISGEPRIEALVNRIQSSLSKPARIELIDVSAAIVSPLYVMAHRKTDAAWKATNGIREKLAFMRGLRSKGVIIHFNKDKQ